MSNLASEHSNPPWREDGELEALTFDIAGETFALEAAIVREILDLLPETAVPGARAFVGSVVNFRGKVIPLADIRLAFGMPSAEVTIDSRIVVVEVDIEGTPTLVGLRTDKVTEVLTLKKSDSEPPPRVGMRWPTELIECLIKRGSSVIIFPDLKAIFAANSRKPAAEAEVIRHPKS
ncbi:MAG: chemotaxis protein CheW [Ancalomicrobiaceae bacterium]|nr:chemotaxis protein CheW [Ancalomicrobiaceae bacterium]